MARILLVDDSRFQRKCIVKMLSELGHEVSEAENGALGLKAAEEIKPDMIISDLLMPEMDGIGLLRGLKSRGCTIPVVVVTADIQECTKQECLELGAKDFLNKPINGVSLEAALNKFLKRETGRGQNADE